MTTIKVDELNESMELSEQETAEVKGGAPRTEAYLTYKLTDVLISS